MYLSYKFYGEKEVAEQQSDQLEQIAKEEKVQTEKAIESGKLLDEKVSEVREGEESIDKASEKLKDSIQKTETSQPTGECKDASEITTEPSTSFLTDDDVRLLKQSHCISDGDPSDCAFGESE